MPRFRLCNGSRPFLSHLQSGPAEIVNGLQIHPEFRRVAEMFRQEKRGLRRNSPLAADHFVTGSAGSGARERGQPGHAEWAEKFFLQNCARMSGDAEFR